MYQRCCTIFIHLDYFCCISIRIEHRPFYAILLRNSSRVNEIKNLETKYSNQFTFQLICKICKKSQNLKFNIIELDNITSFSFSVAACIAVCWIGYFLGDEGDSIAKTTKQEKSIEVKLILWTNKKKYILKSISLVYYVKIRNCIK